MASLSRVDTPASGPDISLGRRLALLRRARGLTLQQVGDAVGCTRSMISAIERNRANPSLTLLRAIAQCLGVSVATLFDESVPLDGGGQEAMPGRSLAVWRELPAMQRQQLVRLADRRRVSVGGSRAVYELLSPSGDCAIELFHVVIAPGGSSGAESFRHTGEEFVLVLRGSLRCLVGDRTYEVVAGDVLYYDSALPHRWENPYEQPAELVTATTPPTW